MKVLLFGASGWIGGQLFRILEAKNYQVIASESRLNNYIDIINELHKARDNGVTHVLNCAGLTGRPNVDWCEDHKVEVLETNVVGTAILANTCSNLKLHYTYMGTGCIFEYDKTHKMPKVDSQLESNIIGFKESDKPNFDGSFYSFGKIMTENITKNLPNTLTLRIRMPISDDLSERNFITKITKYQKVVNIPNSMSVLYDLLPIVPDMMEKERTGIYNFTNPGVISHNQILSLYKQYIDNDFKWQNFTLEEQAEILKAPRSNNYLDTSRLEEDYPQIPNIQDSMIKVFERMAKNIK